MTKIYDVKIYNYTTGKYEYVAVTKTGFDALIEKQMQGQVLVIKFDII